MEGILLKLSGLNAEVWVFMHPIDARKSYDGLYGLVKPFHSHPLSGDVFLFVAKDRKKAKALAWSESGLMILQKRLEEGRFADIFSRGRLSMSELSLFFEGSLAVKQKLIPENRNKKYAV